MSFQAVVKAKIADLELFKQVCKNNDVEFIAQTGGGWRGSNTVGLLKDTVGRASRTTAEIYQDGDTYGLIWDNDPHYASLCARFGKNGGKLIQGYNEAYVSRGLVEQGVQLTERTELSNGDVVAVYAVAGGV